MAGLGREPLRQFRVPLRGRQRLHGVARCVRDARVGAVREQQVDDLALVEQRSHHQRRLPDAAETLRGCQFTRTGSRAEQVELTAYDDWRDGLRTLGITLDGIDDDALRDVVEQNLFVTMWSCHAEARAMVAARTSGVIVNVTSGETTRPSLRMAHYGAAKAAINHLTETLAVELAPHGIRVVEVRVDRGTHRQAHADLRDLAAHVLAD